MISDLNSRFHYFAFHVLLLESAYILNISSEPHKGDWLSVG